MRILSDTSMARDFICDEMCKNAWWVNVDFKYTHPAHGNLNIPKVRLILASSCLTWGLRLLQAKVDALKCIVSCVHDVWSYFGWVWKSRLLWGWWVTKLEWSSGSYTETVLLSFQVCIRNGVFFWSYVMTLWCKLSILIQCSTTEMHLKPYAKT